jgi:very-short-patch-repair endonuclease
VPRHRRLVDGPRTAQNGHALGSAHERASSLDADRFRDNDLAGVGWQTMRFTRLQLTRDRAHSARQLLATAATRGWTPATSSAV